jgi:hypothetical protein
MTPLEDRLQRVEAQLDRLTPSVHERLEHLEQAGRAAAAPKAPTPPPPSLGGRAAAVGKRLVGWMGAELPKFLAAAVLLVFGWGIKDSVDLSIKQRQLDLSYAKEMQSLLYKMSEKNAEKEQLEATMVVLSSYGEASLPSLINELRYTGSRADAAAVGLASLALTHPAAVCEALPRVLANRSRQFEWQAHQKVIRVLGDNNCTKAAAQLQNYRTIVDAAVRGNAAEFVEFVKAPPLAPAEEYPLLLEEVDRSLRLLTNRPAASTDVIKNW